MLEINPYDQPAVQLGKDATYALMGKEGFADLAKKIEPVLMKLVPPKDWTLFSHWLIFHGRRRCKAGMKRPMLTHALRGA